MGVNLILVSHTLVITKQVDERINFSLLTAHIKNNDLVAVVKNYYVIKRLVRAFVIPLVHCSCLNLSPKLTKPVVKVIPSIVPKQANSHEVVMEGISLLQIITFFRDLVIEET